MFLCPTHNFFLDWHWLTIFGTWVYHHKMMCRIRSWSRFNVDLWLQGQIYTVFDMCPAHNFFLVWNWHIMFGTRVYQHKTMCHVHLWSRCDLELWLLGQIYRLLSWLHVQPVTFVTFDIGIPYLAHWFITMRGCVKYVHDPDTTLTFEVKVKFIGFMTRLCVQTSVFLSFDIVILCLALECITTVQCGAYIHELYMTLTLE